tara:strand:+ start:3752 stop:6415 length:2664 start_codon:yes stop_codon:yes gene_type:complete
MNQKLQDIAKGNGGPNELSMVLNSMLLSDNKYERVAAEGASVMLRRQDNAAVIAKMMLEGDVDSPRLYNRRLNDFTRIWGGDPYKDWLKANPTRAQDSYRFTINRNRGREGRSKPSDIDPTNLPAWLKPGDIMISRIGGKISKYDPSMDMELPRNAIFVGLNPGEDTNWDLDALRYELMNKMGANQLPLRGSLQQGIRIEDLRKIDFKQPPMEKQTQWADVLRTNEQLIESQKQLLTKQGMLQKALAKDPRVRPRFRKFSMKNDSTMTSKQLLEGQETVNSIIGNYFTPKEIREFHRRGVNIRIAPLPEDIAGQNIGKEVILDPDTVKRADAITEDVVVHELIHAQNRFREKDNPKVYLRKESILDSPKDIKNDAEIEEAVTEAMTTARLHAFDKSSQTKIPTNRKQLLRRYQKRITDMRVEDLPTDQRNNIKAALEGRYRMTPPDELTFTDNGFNYKLDQEDSRPDEGYWIYALSDDSDRAPKNVDEMREFEDLELQVNVQDLMEGDFVEDYRYYGVENGLKSKVSDLDEIFEGELQLQNILDAKSNRQAEKLGEEAFTRARNYDFRLLRRSMGRERGIMENEFLDLLNPSGDPIGFNDQDGTFITDPMYDASGRFSVNPFEEYGANYEEFINKFPARGVDIGSELDLTLGEVGVFESGGYFPGDPTAEYRLTDARGNVETEIPETYLQVISHQDDADAPIEATILAHVENNGNNEAPNNLNNEFWDSWLKDRSAEFIDGLPEGAISETELIPVSAANMNTIWKAHPLYFEKDGEQFIKSYYDSSRQSVIYKKKDGTEEAYYAFPGLDTSRNDGLDGTIQQRIFHYKTNRRFSGKRYSLANNIKLSKPDVNRAARWLRSKGLNARVVETRANKQTAGYNLYWGKRS